VLEKYHPYITDHILDELVTYFSYRVDRRHAASVAEAILKKKDRRGGSTWFSQTEKY
jgi:hypothetical protein